MARLVQLCHGEVTRFRRPAGVGDARNPARGRPHCSYFAPEWDAAQAPQRPPAREKPGPAAVLDCDKIQTDRIVASAAPHGFYGAGAAALPEWSHVARPP